MDGQLEPIIPIQREGSHRYLMGSCAGAAPRDWAGRPPSCHIPEPALHRKATRLPASVKTSILWDAEAWNWLFNTDLKSEDIPAHSLNSSATVESTKRMSQVVELMVAAEQERQQA